MSMRMRYIDSDKLEVILGEISHDCKKAGLDAQKAGADIVKRAIVKNLESIKTENPKRIKHMCEDVQIVDKKNEFGDVIVKVQGGETTGTLWHIVNDGSYNIKNGKKNNATHFMDIALNQVEQELEKALDESMRKEGF